MYVPIVGFAPDADPTTEGIFTDCDLIIPTLRGVKALPGDAAAGVPAAPSAVASMYAYKLTDGTNRIIGGTEGGASIQSKLYDVTTSDWTDRSAGGGDYTATAAARWTFADYGDSLYAAQKGAQIQKSTGGAFAAVTGAPYASIIVPVLDFIVAFNMDDTDVDATYGDDPNRWRCTAAGNTDDWTINIATQATTGLLADTPGAITAAAAIGSNLVAFKPTALYLGQYVGAPAVWGWQRVPGDGLGAFSHYSVANVEGVGVLFPGRDNFYVFDGSRATPIGTNRVAEFFYSDLDYEYNNRIISFHDRKDWNVYWWYPSTTSAGVLDRFLVYNYRADKWGFGRKTVKFAFEFLEPGLTYNELGTNYSTWDDLPNAPWDTAFASAGTYKPAVVGTDNTVYKLEGVGNNSYYTTNQYGVDGNPLVVTRIRPRFKTAATTGAQVHTYTDQLGTAETTSNASTTMVAGSFDHVWEARWHRVKHSYTGSMEIMGLDIEAKQDSME
jgi:hypothetical protein